MIKFKRISFNQSKHNNFDTLSLEQPVFFLPLSATCKITIEQSYKSVFSSFSHGWASYFSWYLLVSPNFKYYDVLSCAILCYPLVLCLISQTFWLTHWLSEWVIYLFYSRRACAPEKQMKINLKYMKAKEMHIKMI